jgi:hypothetical protein
MTAGPYALHGVTLALVWFLAVNAGTALVVFAVATRLTKRRAVGAPALWLGLRLLPAIASLAFVAVVFVPAYLKYEPRDFVEGFDPALAAVAIAGLAVCAASALRGLVAWARASQRARAWARAARPLALPHTSMPVYQIDVDAPMMALVGILRPRLFITRDVVAALTAEELRASVAHEIGHWRAADNLKRLAMRAAPDVLAAARMARVIERRWVAAAEHVADGRACDASDAGERARSRCALASALVKVARLSPNVTPLAEPISTLVDGGDIASRVHNLLDDAPIAAPRRGSWQWPAAALGSAAVALAYTPVLRAVHALTELIVHIF